MPLINWTKPLQMQALNKLPVRYIGERKTTTDYKYICAVLNGDNEMLFTFNEKGECFGSNFFAVENIPIILKRWWVVVAQGGAINSYTCLTEMDKDARIKEAIERGRQIIQESYIEYEVPTNG